MSLLLAQVLGRLGSSDSASGVDANSLISPRLSAIRRAVLAVNPVASWGLGDGGATAVDDTGNYPGSYSGGYTLGQQSIVPSESDTAVRLDGLSGTAVSVPDALALRFTTAYTLGCWVKFETGALASNPGLISHNGTAYLVAKADGHLETGGISGASWTPGAATPTGSIVEGVGYFAVGTYDGSTLRVYINGKLAGSTNWSGTLDASAQTTSLGYGGVAGGNVLGSMQRAFVCNYALTDAQINAIYAAGNEGGSDTGVGTEASATALAASDSGSGADVSGISLSNIDSGLGSDAVTTVLVTASDSGSGSESSSVALSNSETGSGADAATISPQNADSAAGSDASSFISPKGAETGSGSDAVSSVALASRRNLVPDPSFENDTVGVYPAATWTGTNGGVTNALNNALVYGSWGASGSKSLRLQGTFAAGSPSWDGVFSYMFPVVSGQQYIAGAAFHPLIPMANGTWLHVTVTFFNASGVQTSTTSHMAQIGKSEAGHPTIADGAWLTTDLDGPAVVADATATQARVEFYIANWDAGAAHDMDMLVDAVALYQGTGWPGYSDVVTPPTDSGSATDAVSGISSSSTDNASGSDAVATVLVVASDSGSGADSAVVGLNSTEAGSGADSMAIGSQASDSGSGADAATPISLQSSDSASGVDSGSVNAVVSASDTGTSTDTASIVVGSVDSGSSSESAGISIASSESASGNEVTALLLGATDAASGVDATVSASVSGGDAGSGADFASIAPRDAEVGLGAEANSIAFTITDTGSGTDVVVGLTLVATEIGSGTDLSAVSLIATETGSVVDSTAKVGLGVGDSGSGADGGAVVQGATSVASSDSASSTDAGASTIGVGDGASGTEGAGLGPATTEVGASLEGQSMLLSSSDTGSSADAGVASQFIFSSDAGNGVDVVGLNRLSSSDMAGGTDIGTLIASSIIHEPTSFTIVPYSSSVAIQPYQSSATPVRYSSASVIEPYSPTSVTPSRYTSSAAISAYTSLASVGSYSSSVPVSGYVSSVDVSLVTP